MNNRWSDESTTAFVGPLGECVYASRLLGADETLVLHGGGNTSVKTVETDVYGDPVEVLWIKASGWDLKTIDSDGFVAVDRSKVARLADLDELPDVDMERELKAARLDPEAPCPSVEAMIHAAIDDSVVMHTHADAFLAVANTSEGAERLREIYGDAVVVVPYARSGFRIGRIASIAIERERTEATIGMALMNHGLVTFGSSAREAYDRMITLVTLAEDYIEDRSRPTARSPSAGKPVVFDRVAFAELRKAISSTAGRPVILARQMGTDVESFLAQPDVVKIASRGPITPDHVIWTKYEPMFGSDVDAYAQAYRSYFDANRALTHGSARMLDPAPRVIIGNGFGLATAGPDPRAADIAGDIYRHAITVMSLADDLGGFESLSEQEIFDLEYWELEQAKLDLEPSDGEFSGEVAVVTGAASGIGRACALELVRRGAAVIGLDLSESVTETIDAPGYLGIMCDVTSPDAVSRALDAGIGRFGGVDALVASAGLFPESSPISSHDPLAWRKAMAVNVDAFVQLLHLIHPVLRLAPRGGRVAVIGSKNVQAPGPGASAYSASKTAANQIARIAALEWADEGIRVNSVHPDAVFDTGLWTDELLASRAAKYGMSVDEYKRRNLLGIEITSADVANVVVATLGSGFRAVTGAHIPIDGGNDRVI